MKKKRRKIKNKTFAIQSQGDIRSSRPIANHETLLVRYDVFLLCACSEGAKRESCENAHEETLNKAMNKQFS